jgi:hypothetical protein
LSDKATQFRGDKSDIVRPINELCAILPRHPKSTNYDKIESKFAYYK